MSDSIRKDAEATLAEAEKITAAVLPVPVPAVVPLETATAPRADEIRRRMAELDIDNTQSIISFGSAAQAELQQISQAMLVDVKNKDVGPAGDSLRSMVSTLRGFSTA
ncbi:MAG: toxic anion resistance protein, partial [Gemmobacter sp.]